jgi:hypothetical protein
MKEIRSIEIWFINNTYYLRAFSTTEVGMGCAAKNPIHIISASEASKLGSKILSTLKECQQGIPHPDYRIKEENKMLTETGMKTEKQLMRKGEKVSVIEKEDRLKVYSLYFDGKAMSRHMPPAESSLNPDDITRTVLLAFERCKG